jgi:hypothetical protein
MATRAILLPNAAEFDGANFPQLREYLISNIPRQVLAFDAATRETAYWQFIAPQGLTGTLTAIIFYRMASATTGGIAIDIAIEAITPDDALDTDASNSFDTDNTANETVPGTAGFMSSLSVTLTNADSIAAGDLVRLATSRDVADAADTATGDMEIIAVEFRDGA